MVALSLSTVLNVISFNITIFIVIGKLLLTSLFTFFLINIRLWAEKASRQIRIDFRHLKSLWSLVISKNLASLGVIFKENLAFKNCKISGSKSAHQWAHTFFVKLRVFKPMSHKKYSIHRAQIPWDGYSCYALSIFTRTDIFCTLIRNWISLEANIVNKDSPMDICLYFAIRCRLEHAAFHQNEMTLSYNMNRPSFFPIQPPTLSSFDMIHAGFTIKHGCLTTELKK